MLKTQDTIEVLGNKWLHLDPDGQPSCAVLRDMNEDGPGYIGARRDNKTGCFVFTDKPTRIRATRYHRTRIMSGELLLCTESAAADLGISKFEDPEVLLERAKQTAIAGYDAQHGEGAWQRAEDKRLAAESPKQEPAPTLTQPPAENPPPQPAATQKSKRSTSTAAATE